MRRQFEVRGPLTVLAISLAGSWSTTAAFAACGMAAVSGGASGPPSISTTETSTTQVLEQIRRRTQEAQSPQPIPVSDTSAAPAVEAEAASAANEPAAASPPPAAQAKPVTAQPAGAAAKPVADVPAVKAQVTAPAAKAKVKKQSVSAAQEAAETYDKQPTPAQDYGVIEQSSIVGGISRTTAVWAQGFLGYDRHKNVAPGNQENPTRKSVTGGGLIGADWTHLNATNGVRAFQYGIFSGYSQTRTRISDTFFFTDEIGQDGVNDTNYFRSGNREEVDGPFIGTYLAYVQDSWTFDMAFKADFFDLTQSSTLTQRCGDDVGTQSGSASVNNYMIAANVAHRYDLDERKWWEPVFGIRYTYTDFGSDPSNSVFVNGGVQPTGRLGLEDGSALRLQFGARLGDRIETAEGYIWTTTVGAFLYSDVLINGFESVAGQTGEAVGPVDEGKIRALGQLETRLDVGNGVSYLLQAEVRGGGDVFGAAGQIGMRFEW